MSHFLRSHNHYPTNKELEKVLANTSRKKFKQPKSLESALANISRNKWKKLKPFGKDPQVKKGSPVVSGGLPSLGKRR